MELLIVLLIISLTAAAVQMGDTGRIGGIRLRQEAEQLRDSLLFASDYSIIHQQAVGVFAAPSACDFRVFDQSSGEWREAGALNDDAAPAAGFTLTARSQAPAESVFYGKGQAPFAVLYPDGSILPFTILLQPEHTPRDKLTITLSEQGIIRIEPPDSQQ